MILRQAASGPVIVGNAPGDVLTWNGTEWLPGTGAGGAFNRQDFVVAPAQTVFVLAQLPHSSAGTLVFVNGDLQRQSIDGPPGDYTLVGQTITWVSTDFALPTNAIVSVYYGV